jgi:hypothetical protein
MRKLLIIFFFITTFVAGQDINAWQVLAEVGFETNTTADGYEIDKPIFSKRLQSWNKKKITIKGYLVPLSEINGRPEYMLSSVPFSMCYFCGGAGPETVVELQTQEKIKFVTRLIQIEGTLYLNSSDPDHHMYIIKDAKLIN